MKLLFERSHPGRRCTILPACDVPAAEIDPALCREQAPHLPQMSENELSRHYTELAKQTYGVNDGFYPLGSCTMKYNPKINDQIAALPGFASIHPLQPEETVQGCLEALDLAAQYLCEITGMDDMTFQPAAGAHGELTGLMLIKNTIRKTDTKAGSTSWFRTPPTAPTPPPPPWRASTLSAFRPSPTAASTSRRCARPPTSTLRD